MSTLIRYGWEVIKPASGRLACGAEGKGKLPEPEVLVQYILRSIALPHDLSGKKVLVTAGPTQEALDPVRYLTNHSTGKMGYAIAKMAMLRGADVTLITGPTNIPTPPFVNVIKVVSAKDMFDAVTKHFGDTDFVFKAAAVADYTPAEYSTQKIKKNSADLAISLERTQDILGFLGENKHAGQIICGFSMETENMLDNSRAKLVKKNVHMICSNSLTQKGAGFAGDTNILTLITRDHAVELPLLSKEAAANEIINQALNLYKR